MFARSAWAWGVKFDLPRACAHPASTFPSRRWAGAGVIVVGAVVVFAEHGQVRRARFAAILMCASMMDLAPIGRHPAVRPGQTKFSVVAGCAVSVMRSVLGKD